MAAERIVLVCRVHPSHRSGGMPFVLHDRATALAEAGYDVHVITTALTPVGAAVAEHSPAERYTVHYMPGKSCAYTPEFAQAAHDQTAKLRPHVLHFDSLDFSAPWLSQRPGNPSVVAVTMHGFDAGAMLTDWNMFRRSKADAPSPQIWQKMREQSDVLRRHADKVLAISHHEYDLLRSVYGTTAQQTRLVYNPIAPQFFAPLPPAPLTDVVLMAAISGHGIRNFEWAAGVVSAAGYVPRVVKNVPREQMPAAYDAAWCVLIPTYYGQGYDLVVAEACARRRLSLCSAVGSYYAEFQRLAAEAAHPESPIRAHLGLFELDDAASLRALLVAARTQYLAERAWPYLAWSTSLKHEPTYHKQAWLEAVTKGSL